MSRDGRAPGGLESLARAMADLDRRLSRALARLESGLLTALFLALVALGLAQLGVRLATGEGLDWAAGFVRSAVLWVAMLAASIAAGRQGHFRIRLVEDRLPEAAAGWLARAVSFLAALVCLGLVAAGMRIVLLEFRFPTNAFLNVPGWAVQAIIPVGFALMAWRFMRHALDPEGEAGTGSPGEAK